MVEMSRSTQTCRHENDHSVKLWLLRARYIQADWAETGVSGRKASCLAIGFPGRFAGVDVAGCANHRHFGTDMIHRSSFTALWVGYRGAEVGELWIVKVFVVTP